MSLFLKWLLGSVLCLLPFYVVFDQSSSRPAKPDLDGFVSPLSGMEEKVVAFARATRRLFASKVSATPVGSTFLASDPEHLQSRDAYLKTVFEEQNGEYFYPTVDQGKPVMYELRGLSLAGPYSRAVSNEGKAIGIDCCLLYRYQVEAHRTGGDGSSRNWIPGAPPGLKGFMLVRQGIHWSIETSVPELLD